MAADKILSNYNITHYDFDPDGTSATSAGWVAMENYSEFCASFFRTVGTSAATIVVQAATDSSGTNATTVLTYSGSAPDAVGDYVFLETDAAEIQGASDSLSFTHVGMTITFATGTDEAVVTYIRGGARYANDGETSDSIA